MARRKTSTLLLAVAWIATAASAQDTAETSPADAAPVARIGIVLPKAQLGQGNTGQDVGEPIRQLLMSYMSGPRLEIVPLQAKIAAQVEAEAEAQDCTHVLYTSVEQKKAGKGFGKMLGMLAPAASMLPAVGGLGNASGAMMAGAASQVMATAAMQSAQEEAISSLTQAQAGNVKARDEILLTYQFVTIGGAVPPLEETLKAKAEQNGQDLLGPLAEQVATKAVNAALAP